MKCSMDFWLCKNVLLFFIWIAALRSQRREWGVDCFAALAKTGVGGGLLRCARKDKTPALRLCEERSDVAVQNRGIGLLRCARKDEGLRSQRRGAALAKTRWGLISTYSFRA